MIAETDVKHLQCFGTVRVLTDAKEKEHARSVFRSKYPEVVSGGIREQTRQAFKNMQAVIDTARGSMDNIVQLMIFVADKGSEKPLMEEFGAVFEVKKEFLPNAMPCGTGVRVAELAHPELMLEVQATAVVA